MKIALVGPEIEENLALRYIAASLVKARHEVLIFDFRDSHQVPEVAASIVNWQPQLVGLSMIFTWRAHEFLEVAKHLRKLGFGGHIAAGGHFAALHAEQLLRENPSINSIAIGEGEALMVDLAQNISAPASVDGLIFREASGPPVINKRRPNKSDLDDRPWPIRPEKFHSYLGFPIANLLSSRGCYANCHFCSIHAFHKRSGGPRFRQRDVRAVAQEMAHLYHKLGVRIFNFQDDNFFLPSKHHNLKRFTHLQQELQTHNVKGIAIQAKGRPDCIDPEVVDVLVSMGLFRLFLGVETDAVVGLENLGRGITRVCNHQALQILGVRKIHTCFNLLIFDPDSNMAALRQNIEFMRRQSVFPLNFCRVEVYAGTGLEEKLRTQGRLRGDYLGYSYTIGEERVQRVYEMFREVFWPRNFGAGGMHHESMKLDYNFHLLRHFYPTRAGRALEKRVKGLVAKLNQNSAALMTQLCDFTESAQAKDKSAQHRFVKELCRVRSSFDHDLGRRINNTMDEIRALAARRSDRSRFLQSAASAAAAAAVIVTTSGCAPMTHMCEMAPPPPPVQRPLSADQVNQVTAMVQAQIDAEIGNAPVPSALMGVPIQLDLIITDDGRLQQCKAVTSQHAKEIAALCDYLLGLDVTSLRLARGELGRCEVTVYWGPRPASPLELPIPPDTHMCEMAPPPYDPPDLEPDSLNPPEKDPYW